MSNLDRPRYCVKNETCFVNGCQYGCGAEVVVDGWPKGPGLEPLNDAARRIQAYYHRYQAQPFFPVAPYTAAHGWYLPAILPGFSGPRRKSWVQDPDGTELVSLIPDDEALPEMPRYRVKADHVSKLRWIGKYHQINEGQSFCHLDWPDYRFEAANPAAQAVIDYFDQAKDHPNRTSSPWCCFRQSVYLAALPPIGKDMAGVAAQPLSPRLPIPTAHKSGFTNSVRK